MSCQRCVALEGALLKIIETHKNADYYDTASNCEMKMLEVAKEAIASPTKEPDPSKEPCPEDCDYEATHGYCPYKDHGTPHPPKGDSAGPEIKPPELVNDHAKIRFAEQAVIEAARNMMKVDPSLLNDSLGSAYAIKHYCEVRQALEALERAKGKEDGHDGR